MARRVIVTERTAPVDLVSLRIITDDLERLAQFYERITGVAAVRYTPLFAELPLPSFTLAIGHTQTTQLFGEDSARPAENRSVIIEFKVADVDGEHQRLLPIVEDWVQQPTTMPWGNRSILFRDPDGNLVNLFTPVTDDAIRRAAS
jgi:catechol 2,3-dioxygenase-like lactoylglutathione lyase family enzyme